MKRKTIKLILQTDVVITANSATQGEHEALDFIPGSIIRGVVINNLGGTFNPELFFSGKVRFQNAYPLTQNNQISLPIPFSFHNPKGEKGNLYNAVFGYEKGQPEQLRGNYMYKDKKIVVNSTYRMKTAISREEGYKANDSQLFGYHSIKAGTTYGCSIEFDDDIDDTVVDSITQSIIDKNIHLGKSRTAEYGLVKAELIPEENDYESGIPETNITILYLASDLYLEENGIPVTRLKPKHLGLTDNCEIDWDHSFVRYRKYSPWNSFWKGRMRERQVIRRGSVITLKGKINIDELKNRFEKGYGLFREEGLGRILVNPKFLCSKKVELKEGDSYLSDLNIIGTLNQTDTDKTLIKILEHKSKIQNIIIEAKNTGVKWAEFWFSHWYSKFDTDLLPRKSQWGRVREISQEFHTKPNTTLVQELEKYCDHGISAENWMNSQTEIKIENQRYKLFKYIVHQIEKLPKPELAPEIMFVAAKEISNKIK